MPTPADRYGRDVLRGDWRRPARGRAIEAEARVGLVVEDATSGWCGEIVRVERDLDTLTLEDRLGTRRTFPLGPGWLLEGKPVALVAPRRPRSSPSQDPAAGSPSQGARSSRRTASGSVAVPGARARVARASRIFVEGRHDAELVELVWGDDLRIEGVVVEYLEGADDLGAQLASFGPGPRRRVGVLLDHLVAGSKESRIAEAVRGGPLGADVLIVGHPYVDIWQAVKPARVGLESWPSVPRSVEWKHGICAHLGWPHRDQSDIAVAWKRILGGVRSYADLEPALLGQVERLIDFVTEAPED